MTAPTSPARAAPGPDPASVTGEGASSDTWPRLQFSWLVAVVAVWSAWLLSHPLDPDYTSGELLDHVGAWAAGEPLYPTVGTGPGEALRVLNYPPFVFAAVRGLGAMGLDLLTAARLLDAVAVVLLVVVLGWWLRARGWRGGAVAGAVGLLGASVPFVYATGQFHIEPWAALGTLAGVALLDRGASGRALAWGGVCLGLACLVKQTQVVPGLVMLLWAVRHRKGGLRAVAGFAGVGVLGCAAITVFFGPEAWRHLLTYTVGTYSLENLVQQFGSFVLPWALLLTMAGWRGWAGGSSVRGDAAWWYWCGALAWSFSAGRDGAAFGYFLDLHLATAAWIGPWVFGYGGGWPGAVPGWVRGTQVVGASALVVAVLGVNVVKLEARRSVLPDICAVFPPDGPVLVEEAGVAAACGRRARLHPFITTSLARRGLWDPSGVEADVARGAFGAAVLGNDPRAGGSATRQRWTDAMRAAFRSGSIEAVEGGWWIVRWSSAGGRR